MPILPTIKILKNLITAGFLFSKVHVCHLIDNYTDRRYLFFYLDHKYEFRICLKMIEKKTACRLIVRVIWCCDKVIETGEDI